MHSGSATILAAVLVSSALHPWPTAAARAAPPPPVRHLQVTSATRHAVRLSWSNPTSRRFRGTVVRRAVGGRAPRAPTSGQRVATLTRRAHTVTVRSLTAATRYTFSVFTRGRHHRYGARRSVSIKTTAPPSRPPAAVTSLIAVPRNNDSIGLAWINPSGGLSGVMVRRRPGTTAPSSPSDGTLVADLPAGGNHVVDRDLTAATTYSYAVFAHNAVPQYAAAATAVVTTSTWTATEAPLPAGGVDATNGLGISVLTCPTDGGCIAGGTYRDDTGTLQADLLSQTSGGWIAQPAPVPADAGPIPFPVLNDVACQPGGSCVIVGMYGHTTDFRGLLETYADGSWAATAAPLPANADPDGRVDLDHIACGAGTCVAVGDYVDSDGNQEGLIETLASGDWAATEAPLPPDADRRPGAGRPGGGAALDAGVGCELLGPCVAAGYYHDAAGDPQGLLEVLAGGAWTATQAPLDYDEAPYNPDIDLNAVACGAIGPCVATGSYRINTDQVRPGLLETLNGTTWQATTAPTPADAAGPATINAVTCPAAGSCLAAGGYTTRATPVDGSATPTGLIERLAGGTWTAIPVRAAPANVSRPPLAASSPITDIGCTSPDSCVAVQPYLDATEHQTVALVTDAGGSWTASEAPLPDGPYALPDNPRNGGGYLTTVACSGAGTCVAGGYYLDGAGELRLLLETS